MFHEQHSLNVPCIVYVILAHLLSIVCGGNVVVANTTVPMANSFLHQPIQLHNNSVYIRHIDGNAPSTIGDRPNDATMAVTKIVLKLIDQQIAKQVNDASADMVHVKTTFSPVYCDTDTSDLPIIYQNDTEYAISLSSFNFNEYNVAYLCLIIDGIGGTEQPVHHVGPKRIYHLGLQSQFVR